VKLAPQPFRILALLASRAGEVVTREEIRREVWGEETYVDFERGLNFAISQIRAALEDDAQSPRYIQTLPRRGYRFVAPVETAAEAVPEELPPPAPSRLRLSAWGLVALLGISLIVAFVAWRRRDALPTVEGPRIMVAVLPFEDLSAGPPQPYWSDALTGELIAQLGRLRPERLGVIARTSVMAYKGARRDVGELGRELGVDYLLEGSVRRSGERVRITAQLVQVRDGTQLWAETYERDRRGALDLQTHVGAEVARALALELLPEAADRARAPDPEAWDVYLQGRYLAHQGGRDDLARSVGLFERAVALDPGFALAHAALADVFHGRVMRGALSPRDGYPRAKAAARQAVALDPGLAEAHAVLAAVHFWYDWDWPAAERSFRRALELNPSLSAAHHDYGFFLIARGRAEEGLEEVEEARRLDPLSPRATIDVGWAYISARRYDDAIAQSRRTLELEPGFPEAEGCLEQARRMKGEGTLDLDRRRARQIEEAVSRGERVGPVQAAGVYAALGDRDRAFSWLDKALAERSPMLALLAVHPSWDNLRSDPRFAALAARVGS